MINVLGHLTDALKVVESFDFLDVFFGQLEVENIEVADNSVLGDGFGNDGVADLNLIAD